MQLTELNLTNLLNSDEIRLTDELSKIKKLWHQLNSKSDNVNDYISGKMDGFMDSSYHGPETSVIIQCQSTKAVSSLMSYVFIRRFGWSESSSEEVVKITCRDLSHEKKEINAILDEFILWFQQTALCKEMIEAFENCLTQAQSKPVVRKQAVTWFFEWLSVRVAAGDAMSGDLFCAIKQSMAHAITDVWSAIRSTCVSKFSKLIESFTPEHLKECFHSFAEICHNSSSLWQAKEGAVMGINAIIRQYPYSEHPFNDLDSSSVDFTAGQNNFCGAVQLALVPESSEMPDFVTEAIHSVVFPLLAHIQLSIREQAVRALSSYIARCNRQEVISVFDEVLQRLKERCDLQHQREPSFSSLQPTDAYEVESFLSLCVHFIKTLPADYWRTQRDKYFATFAAYLAHPASSVRQAASNIFKFLIARDTAHPGFMLEILQKLSDGWQPDLSALNEVKQSFDGQTSRCAGFYRVESRTCLPDQVALCDTWQWREGRMLAYELICMLLIKNHWLYTFGSALLAAGTCVTPPESTDDVGSACASPRGPTESPRDIPLKGVRSQLYNKVPIRSCDHMITRQDGRCTIQLPKPLHACVCMQEGRRSRRMSLAGTPQIPEAGVAPDSGLPPLFKRHSSLKKPRFSVSSSNSVKQECALAHAFFLRRRSTSNRLLLHQKREDGSLGNRFPINVGSFTGEQHMSLHGNSQTLSLLMYAHQQELFHLTDSTVKEETSEHENLSESHSAASMSEVLRLLLFQTIQSLADPQWELRRIAQQLLPCVCEVIRWYDAHILEAFWNTYLLPRTSLITYGAALTLKYSLHHAAKLQAMIDDPPSTWQDTDRCKALLCDICDTVRSGLTKHWLPTVTNLMGRPVVDKLSLAALETLMMAEIHFGKSGRSHGTMAIINFMASMSCTAYPGDIKKSYDAQGNFAIAPYGGFLSCCTRAKDSASIQALTAMLVEVQASLNQFVTVVPYHSVTVLLLLLTSWLSHYHADDQLSKSLFISTSTCCSQCAQYMQHLEDGDRHASDTTVTEAITHVAQLLVKKTVDKATRRVVQETYMQISALLPTSSHLAVLLPLISSTCGRTRQNSRMNLFSSAMEKKDFNDLLMRSNDIPTSALPEKAENNLSDEDDDFLIASATGLVQESQALEHSSNSGSLSARFSVSGSSVDAGRMLNGDDDDSDWDDWDTEDKDDDVACPALTDQLKQFLVKLQAAIVKKEGNLTEWDRSVSRLPQADRRAILTLVTGS